MRAEDFSIFSRTDNDNIIAFTDEMYRQVYNFYKYLISEKMIENYLMFIDAGIKYGKLYF